jgi:GNAT superfamily N-acetyltransferase
MALILQPTAGSTAFMLRIGTPADIETLCDIDTDASRLFVRAGLDVQEPAALELERAERARWLQSLEAGATLLAIDAAGRVAGFAASGIRDGEPYLDQLSVRIDSMRLGIGSALLDATAQRARGTGAASLWLTTYRHLAWNRPFYEARGFAVVPTSALGKEMLAVVEFERRWLPAPDQRVVMRKVLAQNP